MITALILAVVASTGICQHNDAKTTWLCSTAPPTFAAMPAGNTKFSIMNPAAVNSKEILGETSVDQTALCLVVYAAALQASQFRQQSKIIINTERGTLICKPDGSSEWGDLPK